MGSDVFAGLVLFGAVVVALLAREIYRDMRRRHLPRTIADPRVFYPGLAFLALFFAVLVLEMVLGNTFMVDLVSLILAYFELASFGFLIIESFRGDQGKVSEEVVSQPSRRR